MGAKIIVGDQFHRRPWLRGGRFQRAAGE
jgi:hypothetical protein